MAAQEQTNQGAIRMNQGMLNVLTRSRPSANGNSGAPPDVLKQSAKSPRKQRVPKVLHGHEELVALRMRAYGDAGDRAGVNAEWSSYERSLLHDSWSGGAPSPRIVALKRELIG